MRTNFVKRRLRDGKPSVGAWLSVASPFTAEYMCRIGFDWLVVDMEHSPIAIDTAALMVSAMFASSSVPLIRMPANTGENIKRALETGAWGIIVPMVKSAEEAAYAVRHSKYAPEGCRSVGGSRHALGFGVAPAEYFAHANREIMVIVQIEHIDAVDRADEILAVPGIDACFIGPNDLMSSMGIEPQMDSDDPRYRETLGRVEQAARRHGVALGIHVADAEAANRRIAAGYQFVAVSSEFGFMMSKAGEELAKLRPGAVEHASPGVGIRY